MSPSLRTAVHALAEDARTHLRDHPPAERLAAYHAGELPQADAEELRDHLALCRQCGELLLDLARFPNLEPPREDQRLDDEDVRQQWYALAGRLRAEARGFEDDDEGAADAARVLPMAAAREGSRRPPWRAALPLAATLVLAAGLLFSLLPWRGLAGGEPSLRPSTQVPSPASLVLSTQIKRSAPGPEDLQVARLEAGRGDRVVDLTLRFRSADRGGSYRLILRDATTREQRWISEERPVPETAGAEELRLELPRRYAPGRYDLLLRLTGEEGTGPWARGVLDLE